MKETKGMNTVETDEHLMEEVEVEIDSDGNEIEGTAVVLGSRVE